MFEVFAYSVDKNDFDFFESRADWEAQMTCAGARTYLLEHLCASLDRDLPPTFDVWKRISRETGTAVGFYAGARELFPYISFLGSLYRGADTSLNSIAFMEEYLGRRASNDNYVKLSATVFTMYRHGLIHTAAPKCLLRDDGKLILWGLSNDPSDHLACVSRTGDPTRVWVTVCAEALYRDLRKAIEVYAQEFETQGTPSLNPFLRGFLDMAQIFRPSDLQKNKKAPPSPATLALKASLAHVPG